MILIAMKNGEIKLYQGKEEWRMRCMFYQVRKDTREVLRGGSCDPDALEQTNERILKLRYKLLRVCRDSLTCSKLGWKEFQIVYMLKKSRLWVGPGRLHKSMEHMLCMWQACIWSLVSHYFLSTDSGGVLKHCQNMALKAKTTSKTKKQHYYLFRINSFVSRETDLSTHPHV